MGRFYSGDIEGKFWFGVQDSDDIKNLVTIKGNNDYSWKVCNCVAEIDDSDYCRSCYESKNEHIEQAIEEEEYEDDYEIMTILELSDSKLTLEGGDGDILYFNAL